MAYTDQEKQKWVEIAQDTGSSIERGAPVLTLGELDTTVSIPGVKFSSISYDEEGNVTGFGTPEKYAQLPLGTLAIKTRAAQDAADAANTAAARANTASDGAEKVDASIVGMTVTITDRQGVSRSVNIGFEIYKVYGSVAAMKADAANVPYGAFVMIATADPTSTENAQLWARNAEPATSANPFTFLSDLDQAATHAWDDWNTNLRQAVVDATNNANTAATNANNKASAANTAASNANTATANANTATTNANTAATNANNIKNEVTTWFKGTNNNGFKNTAETWLTTTQTTWNNWFSDSLSNGVRKLWNTFWASINSSWNGFWGTSETDPNGVRKQWADLHSQAQSDHTIATSDHTRAQSDHSTAASDHTTAQSDHTASTSATTAATNATTAANNAAAYANTQGNYSKNMADHPAYIGEDNYWYIWNYAQQKYVKSSYAKGDDLDWDSMTEEEKQALADEVLSRIAFDSKPTSGSSNAVTSGGIYTALGNREKIIEASVATSQSIVDELT